MSGSYPQDLVNTNQEIIHIGLVQWGAAKEEAKVILRGHEATETGFACAPVSQAHGHYHIVQCHACCTAA